jgi:hypothetical protein
MQLIRIIESERGDAIAPGIGVRGRVKRHPRRDESEIAAADRR